MCRKGESKDLIGRLLGDAVKCYTTPCVQASTGQGKNVPGIAVGQACQLSASCRGAGMHRAVQAAGADAGAPAAWGRRCPGHVRLHLPKLSMHLRVMAAVQAELKKLGKDFSGGRLLALHNAAQQESICPSSVRQRCCSCRDGRAVELMIGGCLHSIPFVVLARCPPAAEALPAAQVRARGQVLRSRLPQGPAGCAVWWRWWWWWCKSSRPPAAAVDGTDKRPPAAAADGTKACALRCSPRLGLRSAGDKNGEHFFVATQDRALQVRWPARHSTRFPASRGWGLLLVVPCCWTHPAMCHSLGQTGHGRLQQFLVLPKLPSTSSRSLPTICCTPPALPQRACMAVPGGAVIFASVNGVHLETPSELQKQAAKQVRFQLQSCGGVGDVRWHTACS